MGTTNRVNALGFLQGSRVSSRRDLLKLAGALGRFPRTFNDLYRGLVAVGAETGRLGEVLERLADYLEARQALKQKFTLALIYPALVTISSKHVKGLVPLSINEMACFKGVSIT